MLSQDEVRQVLEEIAAKHDGVLRPNDLVEEARAEDHPLHARFDWDNDSAAHAHRLEQARTLIRSVKVVTKTEKRTVETVYYMRNPSAEANDAGYVSLPRLKTSTELTAAALVQEFARAVAVLKRARDLAEACGINRPLDEMITQLESWAGEVVQEEVRTAV